MKKVKEIVVIFILMSLADGVNAQQQVMFTQYMFNGLALNPAYAGSHETVSITALARKQWTGLDGAPSTQTFSIHSPIVSQRMSLGLLVLHDNIGVTDQTGIYGSYAYRIPVNDRGKLAFGLQGGMSYYNAQFSKVSATDPTFANDVREMSPTFGFGMYYHTDRFYVGVSVPQLNESSFGTSNQDNKSIVRHYFASAGYVFDLSHSLKLKPNVLVKAVEGAPVEFDVNANLLIKEVVWVGVSWRSFDSVDALLQLQLAPQLQIGYAFDFATTSELSQVNGGSHELMLNYRISVNRDRIVTPRYF
jgi:type IX secretion system PorP/SprF family membrane protein